MKSALLVIVRAIFSKVRSLLSKGPDEWKVILTSLLFAILLWFFTALNKTYTQVVKLPLEITYDQEKYIPLDKLPTYIEASLEGDGWQLIKLSKLFRKPPLNIDVPNPMQNRSIGQAEIASVITAQLKNLRVKYLLSDTIKFNFDKKISRSFELTVDTVGANLSPSAYFLYSVDIAPVSSVEVTGPESILMKWKSPMHLSLSKITRYRSFIAPVNCNLNSHFGDTFSFYPSVVSLTPNISNIKTISKQFAFDTAFINGKAILLDTTLNVEFKYFELPTQTNYFPQPKFIFDTIEDQVYPTFDSLPTNIRSVSIEPKVLKFRPITQ